MYDSVVRTVVPYLVGVLIALAGRVGLELPEGALTEVITALVTFAAGAAYYWLGRLVEQVRPGLGRVLLSFGLAKGTNPVYSRIVKEPTGRLPLT